MFDCPINLCYIIVGFALDGYSDITPERKVRTVTPPKRG